MAAPLVAAFGLLAGIRIRSLSSTPHCGGWPARKGAGAQRGHCFSVVTRACGELGCGHANDAGLDDENTVFVGSTLLTVAPDHPASPSGLCRGTPLTGISGPEHLQRARLWSSWSAAR